MITIDIDIKDGQLLLSKPRAMTRIVWLFDTQDDIDLVVVRVLCATLTTLTFCGYIVAVSKMDLDLNVHIMAFAIILLAITILGYSVFHVKVMTDNSSDATLFNLFSTIWAFSSEARSCLLVCLISNEVYLWMNPTTVTIILFAMLFITLICLFNIVGLTCCSVIKQLSPTLYLRMSQSWISAKIISAVEIVASALTILTVVHGCKGDIPCVQTLLYDSMMNVGLASAVILMIMTDCALRFLKGQTKSKFCIRNKIMPRETESNSDIVSQVCVL